MPNRNWNEIKQAYFAGGGSLRTLAEKFQICFSTIGKRAGRENWFSERERLRLQLEAKTRLATLEAAEQRGKELGVSAADFAERNVREVEVWLDRIERLAESGALDADTLKSLTESWRTIIREGRAAHGLDREQTSPQIQVNIAPGRGIGSEAARRPAKKLGYWNPDGTYVSLVDSKPLALPPGRTTDEPSKGITEPKRE